MAAGQLAGAPSHEHEEEDWHAINWRAVNRNVRRLQARIVQATLAGRWGKVKALQWLLVHSFSAQAEAVKRVTENRGKRTAGGDGETWNTPKQKAEAVHQLGRRRDYKLQTVAAEARAHPQEEGQDGQDAAFGHPDDAGSGGTGTAPVGAWR